MVYLFVHSGPMDWAFYGVEMRHQDTPAPRVYPLLLLAVGCKHAAPRFRSPHICPLLLFTVGCKHTAPRFRSPHICPLLLFTVGCKHTAPRFRSPRICPLLLLTVGRKHAVPRLPTPQVVAYFALDSTQQHSWMPKRMHQNLSLQAVFHLLVQFCFCPIGISVVLIYDVSLTV